MSDFLEASGLFFRDMFLYMMIAVFMENTIFSRAIGTSTALFAVRKRFNLLLFGLVMTLIITVSSLITYLLNPLVRNWGFSYYTGPIIYVAVIGVVYIAALLLTQRLIKKRREEILSMIHVTAFNCAVLGALMLAANIKDISLGGYLGFGVGSGVGFTMAAFIVRVAYERLSGEDVPRSFRGFPITLLYIGIVSLAIYGLIGHQLPF